MTMLQQFVRTAELEKVAAAANAVLSKERVRGWRLRATGHYYIPSPPLGIAGIVVEPTEALHRLQRELLDAVAPFTERTGTPAAFYSTEDGRDIQPGLIDYVTDFVAVAAGDKFNPHVTIGVAPRPISTRCSPNRSRPSRSRRWRGGLPARHLRRRPPGACIGTRLERGARAARRAARADVNIALRLKPG